MEKFKHRLRIRFRWQCAAILLLAALYVALLLAGKNLVQMPAFMQGYLAGFFFACELLMVIWAVSTFLALRNEAKLKKLYIEETDERTLLIQQKSGSTAFPIIALGLAAAIIAAGFFNQTVFFTLLAVLVCIGGVRIGLKIYYTNQLGG